MTFVALMTVLMAGGGALLLRAAQMMRAKPLTAALLTLLGVGSIVLGLFLVGGF